MSLELPKQREPSTQRPPASHSSPPISPSPKSQPLSSTQREHQALQDLVDLAEEGMSTSPWSSSLGAPTGETLGGVLGGTGVWAAARFCSSQLSVCPRTWVGCRAVVSLTIFAKLQPKTELLGPVLSVLQSFHFSVREMGRNNWGRVTLSEDVLK